MSMNLHIAIQERKTGDVFAEFKLPQIHTADTEYVLYNPPTPQYNKFTNKSFSEQIKALQEIMEKRAAVSPDCEYLYQNVHRAVEAVGHALEDTEFELVMYSL